MLICYLELSQSYIVMMVMLKIIIVTVMTIMKTVDYLYCFDLFHQLRFCFELAQILLQTE